MCGFFMCLAINSAVGASSITCSGPSHGAKLPHILTVLSPPLSSVTSCESCALPKVCHRDHTTYLSVIIWYELAMNGARTGLSRPAIPIDCDQALRLIATTHVGSSQIRRA